ncbi:hypothetical protein IWQ60_012541, partial [Tieghemiomyces parasiticus]
MRARATCLAVFLASSAVLAVTASTPKYCDKLHQSVPRPRGNQDGGEGYSQQLQPFLPAQDFDEDLGTTVSEALRILEKEFASANGHRLLSAFSKKNTAQASQYFLSDTAAGNDDAFTIRIPPKGSSELPVVAPSNDEYWSSPDTTPAAKHSLWK